MLELAIAAPGAATRLREVVALVVTILVASLAFPRLAGALALALVALGLIGRLVFVFTFAFAVLAFCATLLLAFACRLLCRLGLSLVIGVLGLGVLVLVVKLHVVVLEKLCVGQREITPLFDV